MARAPTPTIARDSVPRPQAAPVDTYARPQARAGSNLHQLAEALSSLGPAYNELSNSYAAEADGLSDWLDRRRAHEEKQDAERAEAAFLKNNQEGYADAVRSGRIPSYASPTFVATYKAAEGRSAGVRLSQQFQSEYDSWDGKNGEDPEAFNTFYQDFVRRNVSTDDPAVLRGLLPHLDSLAEAGQRQFQQDLSRSTYDRSVEAHSALAGQSIDQYEYEGLAREDGTDYAALATSLMDLREEAIASGVRDDDFDEQVVDVVVAKALEHKDPSLLDILDQQVPGRENSFADTPYGRDKKLAATTTLENMAESLRNDYTAEQRRLDDRAKDAAHAAAIDHLLAGEPIPEELLVEGSKPGRDPEFRVRVLGWADTLRGAKVAEDPEAVQQLYRDILEGGGMAAMQRALDNGVIRSHQTLKDVRAFTEQVGEGVQERVLQGPIASNIMGSIKERTRDSITEAFNPEGVSDAGLAAQTDYQIRLIEWMAATPNATLGEIRKAQGEIGAEVLNGIAGGPFAAERADSSPAYTRTPETQEQVGASSFTEGVNEPSPDERERAAWFSGLAPEQQQKLADRAAESGDTVESVRDEMWDAMQALEPEAPVETPEAIPQSTPARDPGETLGDYIDRVLGGEDTYAPEDIQAFLSETLDAGQVAATGDPVANGLLDLIASVEGPGGYSQRFGEPEGGSRYDLTAMTLDEVASLPANRVGELRSTASGRYQFLGKTLKSLKRDLGLDGTELFTAELQDRLALALLERRGYRDFLSGEITVEAFADNLAQEWASLPRFTGLRAGRSHYRGQKAGLRIDQMLAALGVVSAT